MDLIRKNFFGIEGLDPNELGLIDRINLFFKGNNKVEFSDEEKVWVDRAAKTETPKEVLDLAEELYACLLYTSPSPRDGLLARMPSSA